MIDRHANEVPLIAAVVYHVVLAVLCWPPAVLALWVLEDAVGWLTYDPRKEDLRGSTTSSSESSNRCRTTASSGSATAA